MKELKLLEKEVLYIEQFHLIKIVLERVENIGVGGITVIVMMMSLKKVAQSFMEKDIKVL
jgi:hypothetical protein